MHVCEMYCFVLTLGPQSVVKLLATGWASSWPPHKTSPPCNQLLARAHDGKLSDVPIGPTLQCNNPSFPLALSTSHLLSSKMANKLRQWYLHMYRCPFMNFCKAFQSTKHTVRDCCFHFEGPRSAPAGLTQCTEMPSTFNWSMSGTVLLATI